VSAESYYSVLKVYSKAASALLVGRSVANGATIRGVSLDLTEAELATAATACRAMAYQEGERAKKMENPSMRGPLESNAKRFADLAAKLEAARKRR
jgi:hypothetical protein